MTICVVVVDCAAMGVCSRGNLLIFATAFLAGGAVRSDNLATSHLIATETAVRKGAGQEDLCSTAADRIRTTFYKACSDGLLVNFMCDDEQNPGESACTRRCEANCESAEIVGSDVRQVSTTVTTTERMNLNVSFEFDSARLKLDATTLNSLNLLAYKLRTLPDRQVKIEGYTDDVGTAQYNLDLSLRRANAVKTFLVRRENISSARIETVGYGFSRPIAPNSSSEGRARNRRMEAEFEGASVRVKALTSS